MYTKGFGAEVLLTADQTLMSDYHHNIFVGFGTCVPSNIVPDWLYRFLFFPPIKTKDGIPSAAPYGLRKIEAQLLSEGIEALTVAPTDLKRWIDKAKVLGIYVMDPFGLGPASSTFASIFHKEPFLAQYFRALLNREEVKRAKKRGLKIIVGGPGVWQFNYRPEFPKKYGIDCIVKGEAEKVVGRVFRDALQGKSLPEHFNVSVTEVPKVQEIPEIVNPSINGLVELGRGCCRGCEFCSVTLRPLRWYPFDKIMREIDVNMKVGGMSWSCLHAEDVMLYGSKDIWPKDEKLIKLHELAVKKTGSTSWSHSSLASVAAKPDLFSKVSEIICQKQPWWGAEIGIETGSPTLAKKIMPAKARPFNPEEWPDVVRTGMGLMHDNNMVPASTLIVGLPEETEKDLIQTIELVDDLRCMRSLIVPLFFVPMGRLRSKDWFKDDIMSDLHRELIIRCVRHDMSWIDELINMGFTGRWYRIFLRSLFKVFVKIADIKAGNVGI